MNPEEQKFLDDCVHLNLCEELLRRYWESVRYIVIRAFRLRHTDFTAEDIEELRNDVFLQLFDNERRKLRQYDETLGLSLKNWIALIANQTVGMYLRKKDRIGHLGTSRLMPIEELAEELGIQDEARRYEAIDILQRIEDALKHLPHQERLVFLLFFKDGLSSEEIASVQNKKRNSVDQIRHRAIIHLKEILRIM